LATQRQGDTHGVRLDIWTFDFDLRLFGAKIGQGVVLKPSINVKYPWHLEIGNYSWIGEGAWFDSLAPIRIGSNCCISQGVYFCLARLSLS
jgi:acetyltransferase-like isoleucine patch superfamily enzyme